MSLSRPSSYNPRTPTPATETLRIRSTFRRAGNLLLDLPIGGRLTIGFLTAALIAALLVGTIGILRAQSLNKQSDFYQNLLQTNTTLTTGANFLQLMDTEMHLTLDQASLAQPSQETLRNDQTALQKLTARYDTILTNYIAQDLLIRHNDQVALLAEANHQGQVGQQITLAASTLRTWQVYRAAQSQILADVTTGNLAEAQHLEQTQGEPTHADAESAIRALIQFDQRLATSVQDAASVEEQSQLITTIVGSILAFLAIVLVGWLISGTLVKRLKHLRRVTQSVEQGQLDARVTVVGRDEIADVSASVNAMLGAIVGLLEETRRQRDVLTNAAEHLFSDMRVVSAGDLRITASVSNDPIGMLANAFNFTVGRFRRFVLRTQIATDQIDVISRQEMERSAAFAQTLNNHKGNSSDPPQGASALPATRNRADGKTISARLEPLDKESDNLIAQVRHVRERLLQLSDEGVIRQTRSVLVLAEQISLALSRLSRAMTTETESFPRTTMTTGDIARVHVQELHTLERMLQRMINELQNLQKNTVDSSRELDTDLTKVAAAVHTLRPKNTQAGAAMISVTDESIQDVLRQGTEFTNEIITMARQLAVLANEMRSGAVSFQLDTANSGGTSVSSPNNRVSASIEPETRTALPQRRNFLTKVE